MVHPRPRRSHYRRKHSAPSTSSKRLESDSIYIVKKCSFRIGIFMRTSQAICTKFDLTDNGKFDAFFIFCLSNGFAVHWRNAMGNRIKNLPQPALPHAIVSSSTWSLRGATVEMPIQLFIFHLLVTVHPTLTSVYYLILLYMYSLQISVENSIGMAIALRWYGLHTHYIQSSTKLRLRVW